jgi:NAD+ kinase
MPNKKPFNDISIILKPSDYDDLTNLITNLVRWLHRRKKTVILLKREFKRLEPILSPKVLALISFRDEKAVYRQSDLIISLGGDGTLLGVYRQVSSRIPIFGVNLGHLGFITEFNKHDFYEKLNVVLAGKYELIKKQLFSVNINNKEKYHFLNDAVFSQNNIARMLTLSVEADKDHIYNLSGDGLIISSTIGSTAYSLAAGGPIVHPSVKALLLTPICPHSLTHRPLVLPENSEITVQLMDHDDTANITLDGQNVVSIKSRDNIKINKETRKSVLVIKNDEKSYFHTLKEKFVHGRREV